MIGLRHLGNSKPWVLAVAATALAAVTIGGGMGVFMAVRASHTDTAVGTLSVPQAPAAGAANLSQLVSPGDAAIDFPEALSSLVQSPFELAVDPVSGRVWFAVFQHDDYKLFGYDPTSGNLESHKIPASPASELFSGIAAGRNGHVYLGYGDLVVDFDPVTRASTTYDLPSPSNYAADLDTLPGVWVTDLAVAPDGVVYVTRLNVAAVTQIDPAAGDIYEIPYPESFGPSHRLAVTGDTIWVSGWGDQPDNPARMGTIERSTGEFVVAGQAASSIVAKGDGEILAAAFGSRALLQGRDRRTEAIDSRSLEASLTGSWDFLALDETRQIAWLAGDGRPTIARYDLTTGETQVFSLPFETVPTEFMSCPRSDHGCPDVGQTGVLVRGLAVALNGDLYFSDAQGSRVGVIRAIQ